MNCFKPEFPFWLPIVDESITGVVRKNSFRAEIAIA